MDDNIIRFPIERSRERRRKKIDELSDVEFSRYEITSSDYLESCYARADNYAEEITSDILAFLHDEGMPIESSSNVNDISIVFEALRSMLLKHHDIYHPIQAFVDSMYERNTTNINPDQLEFDF